MELKRLIKNSLTKLQKTENKILTFEHVFRPPRKGGFMYLWGSRSSSNFQTIAITISFDQTQSELPEVVV